MFKGLGFLFIGEEWRLLFLLHFRHLKGALIHIGPVPYGINIFQEALGHGTIRLLERIDNRGDDIETDADPDKLFEIVAGCYRCGQNSRRLDNMKKIDEREVAAIQALALADKFLQVIQLILLKD